MGTAAESRPGLALLVGRTLVLAACLVLAAPHCARAAGDASSRPAQPVKLVFVHHSCGENWLADEHGGLARALQENNYFLSDTNYGWGPDGIGDRTDIVNWPEWFSEATSPRVLQALLAHNEVSSPYARTLADPGGRNRIVLFKSCFPNSQMEGKPSDEPRRGEGLTVGNAKAIYIELLAAFAKRPDLLFVAVTAPPLLDASCAESARAFNNWLVRDWLAEYKGSNVAVFDFYNVLTSPGNHHRFRAGRVEHVTENKRNTLYYPTKGDAHPSEAGNRKATAEFIPLLNTYHQRWLATAPESVEPESKPETTVRPTPEEDAGPEPEKPRESAEATPLPAVSGDLIADFENGLEGWEMFFDPAESTSLRITIDEENAHGGTAGLRVQYDVAAGAWANCSMVYHRGPRDWTARKGVSFYFRTPAENQEIVFIAYQGDSADALAVFELPVRSTQEAVAGWQRVDVTWDQLAQPSWQGDPDVPFDRKKAMGIAFSINPPEAGRSKGQFHVDDIRFE